MLLTCMSSLHMKQLLYLSNAIYISSDTNLGKLTKIFLFFKSSCTEIFINTSKWSFQYLHLFSSVFRRRLGPCWFIFSSLHFLLMKMIQQLDQAYNTFFCWIGLWFKNETETIKNVIFFFVKHALKVKRYENW